MAKNLTATQHNNSGLSIQEVKTCLRAYIALDRVGLADTPINRAVVEVRIETIRQRGIRRYLFDMLGNVANMSVGEVCFLDDRGEVIEPGGDAAFLSLADYLERYFIAETLPVRIVLTVTRGVREFVL